MCACETVDLHRASPCRDDGFSDQRKRCEWVCTHDDNMCRAKDAYALVNLRLGFDGVLRGESDPAGGASLIAYNPFGTWELLFRVGRSLGWLRPAFLAVAPAAGFKLDVELCEPHATYVEQNRTGSSRSPSAWPGPRERIARRQTRHWSFPSTGYPSAGTGRRRCAQLWRLVPRRSGQSNVPGQDLVGSW